MGQSTVIISRPIDDDTKPSFVEMTVTPYMEGVFKSYPFFLEVEMMSGERCQLDDGCISYKFTIEDPEKSEMITSYVTQIAFSHNKQSPN